MSKIPVILIVILIICAVGAVGFFWIKSAVNLDLTNAQVLNPGTFKSSLRLVRETDPETGKLIRQYYVLDTQNTSEETFYNCKFSLISKGDQKKYDAFYGSYVLKNCKVFSEVQPHYDCTLTNKLTEWLKYDKLRNREKFASHTTATIAMGSFYDAQTITANAFLTQNALSDIYSVDLACKLKTGRPVTHSQIF